MYSVFTEPVADRGGKITFPEFMYTRGGLLREKAKIIEYYREYPQYLDSRHFLVRLLQSITVPFGDNRQLYFDKVADFTPRLSKSLNMTSPVGEGELFDPGVFYGEGAKEILVAIDEEFDLDSDWRDLRPLWVLRHDLTNLSMRLPDGRRSKGKETIAVIAINIPMLAFQFQRWMRQDMIENPNDPRSISQFLMAYPIPNMLHSHLDIAILNRLIYGPIMGDTISMRAHPFFVTDYTDRVDKVLRKQERIFEKKRMEFPEMLSSIPLVDAANAQEALRLPELPPTRQVEWALILARLPYLTWLLEINHRTENRHNREWLKRIRRSIREIRSDNTVRKVLPRDMYERFEATVEERLYDLT